MTTLIYAAAGLVGCMQFRTNDRTLEREAQDARASFQIGYLNVLGRTIRFAEAGLRNESRAPLVLFIHGAPGSLDAFQEYMLDPVLQERARLVSFDRPGYGYSEFGSAEPSMQRQAELVVGLIDALNHSGPVLAVGHSYGGTLALQTSVDSPETISASVLLAPSVSPSDEVVFWFNRPASWLAVRWILPRAWRVANVEKLSQVANLEAVSPRISRLRVPTTVIHGTDDRLVPYPHATFLERLAPAGTVSLVSIPQEGHFLPWSQYQLVRETIVQSLETVRSVGDPTEAVATPDR